MSKELTNFILTESTIDTMNLEEFKQVDAHYREERAQLFQLSLSDPQASNAQLASVEKCIGIQLPDSYRDFLREFGGGDFGCVTIFSADPSSRWYLPTAYMDAGNYLPKDLLPFYDDETGGFFVFKIEGHEASNRVFYWHADNGLIMTKYKNIFEFIKLYAYDK